MQSTAVKNTREENTPANDNVVSLGSIHTQSSEPVVVFMPFGNYNQLTELGRYKNLEVAMKIMSSINHPDNAFQIPEYKTFSLETGEEIFVH